MTKDHSWINEILLHNFMNHKHTVLPLSKEGLQVLFGPNGVGKSAIQEALSCIEREKSSSRFPNFAAAFSNTEPGYVELRVNVGKGNEKKFKKEFKKGHFSYFINEKRVTEADFLHLLHSFNLVFNESTMIRQNGMAQKFKGKGSGSLREMVENITGDTVYVEEYSALESKLAECSSRVQGEAKKLSTFRGEIENLENKDRVLRQHIEISRHIQDLEHLMIATQVKTLEKEYTPLQYLHEKSLKRITKIKTEIKTVEVINFNCANEIDETLKVDAETTQRLQDLNKQIEALQSQVTERENLVRANGYEVNKPEKVIKTFDEIKHEIVKLKAQELNLPAKVSNEAILVAREDLAILKKSKENLLGEINKCRADIEEIAKEDFDAQKLERLNSDSAEYRSKRKEITFDILPPIEEQLHNLGINRVVPFPEFLKFEKLAQNNGVIFEGPACYILKLKAGIKNREKIRNIIARSAGNKLGWYLVQDGDSYRNADKIIKNNNIKNVNVELIKPETKERPQPKVTQGLGYLVDFLDIPTYLRRFAWDVIGKLYLVPNDDLARELAYQYTIPTITLQGKGHYPQGHGITPASSKRDSLFLNQYGMDDPKSIKSRKEELTVEKTKYEGQRAELDQKISETESARDRLLVIKDQKDKLPVWIGQLNDNIQKSDELKNTIALKEDSLRQMEESLAKWVAHENEEKLFTEKHSILQKVLEHIQNFNQCSQQIEDLKGELLKFDQKDIIEKLNHFRTTSEFCSRTLSMLQIRLDSKKIKQEALTSKLESMEKQLKTKRGMLPKNYTSPEEKTDEEEIRAKIQDLTSRRPSLLGIEPDTPQRLADAKKELARIEGVFSTLEDKREKIRQTLNNASSTWATEFSSKISKIEQDTCELLKFLGIHVKMELKPMDIKEGSLSLSVSTPNGMIDADSLSGGQKSLFNLALFLGANYYSKNQFFILDEVDQNLDPASTEKARQVLDKFAEKRQVILITPGKDPHLLKGSKAIFMSNPRGEIEIMSFQGDKELERVLAGGE